MTLPAPPRAAIGAALLAAGLLAAPLGSPHAHAVVACRSDPIVVLSNGVVLDLSADIADDVSDVTSVRYTLHGPFGVWVMRAISTDGPVGYDEGFAYIPDAPVGVYQDETVVTTGADSVNVTATVAGGYASTLGVTPGMVGLKSWVTTTQTTKKKAPPQPKGAPTLSTLPAKVTASLSDWASAAAWSSTASAQGLSGETLSATVSM